MKHLKLLLATIILAISFNVSAQSKFIATIDSTENETEQQFVVRVAKFIQKWTNKNNAEICGWVQVNAERKYRVNLVTDGSQVFCMLKYSKIDEGFNSTGKYIHSHPNHDKNFIVETTSNTRKANKFYGFEVNLPEFYVVERGFSKGDYQTSGWLVDNGSLWYQEGKGTETNLGNLNKM